MQSVPRQPLLSDSIICLHAPTQVWCAPDGQLGSQAVHGVYHGDLRHIAALRVHVEGSPIEWISNSSRTAGTAQFGAVLRGLDGAQADPKLRLLRERTVTAGEVRERLRLESHLDVPVTTRVTVTARPDFAPMQLVKAGESGIEPWSWDGTTAAGATGTCTVHAPGSDVVRDGDELRFGWDVTVPPFGAVEHTFALRLADPTLVVAPADAAPLAPPTVTDPQLGAWLRRAVDDLAALRLTLPGHPDQPFYAAGAPWFFTLFGRDSIWAARLALPLDLGIAVSTLQVLARLQGTKDDPETAEAPGKILHELRSAPLTIPGEGVHLPPLYYGSVDATPLWVCLLADAHDAGMTDADVRALLPNLRSALGWLTTHGGASGNGFIDYVDTTGRGLANQGWKDSGDSIQWRDGSLARGPIALCEVQAYAYEAATRGAALLDAFGEAGGDDLRAWASELRLRFRERFWVTTAEGRYPAIALDRDGRAVDTLTSNIGHLIGTGLLEPEEEQDCVDLLVRPTLSSGFGIRTMSTEAAGYWPLSYHGGSVWAHDSAIAVRGMLRSGFGAEAAFVARQLVTAAAGFDDRMPELHSGDSSELTPRPTPYPASCRPQAWSAAAAVVCAEALS